MPSIDGFTNKRTNKKFKKKAHRPWNVTEGLVKTSDEEYDPAVIEPPENAPETTDNHTITGKESIGNQLKPIGDQLATKMEPIRGQIKTNNTPISNHLAVSMGPDNESISNQVSNQSTAYEAPNTDAQGWGLDKATYELRRLYGLQRKIVYYIGTQCIASGKLVSGPITVKALQELLNTDVNTIKTALHRVVTKGFFQREESKRGTGGFSTFKISIFLRQALLNDLHYSQISNQLDTNSEPSKVPMAPLSSRSNYITTTTEQMVDKNFPPDWQSINFIPLEGIGFGKSHLLQIYKFGQLSPEMVQDSINAFAFDLDVNNKGAKIKAAPLYFFMGILRNGMPYAAPENYEDLETRALKRYLENKKKQQAHRESIRQEAYNLALEEWEENLTSEQVAAIIPEQKYREEGSPIRKGTLNLHFKKEIWPTIEKQMGVSC